ncbi:MAG: glycosyltransferase family 1 protein [Pelatocladus maniniholoensis HA4357-MV3]|jgi:glycosyltransferase involved in cell wall biosynthesis|uniref:Glycosyltransferase family 1 protein n=1 Tax=Pelatocladus maniniholoensis HA4357-MV3 TaxID=1117104 RepID=A0A9E3H935_9NOST|nr:glycosyltransferase family 1 protein [Pelatocladus maniniholoensis HA4357-MV3]BAZ68531.1 group 1 glycosyl transferase [Fischerella sp. NIES-4106]
MQFTKQYPIRILHVVGGMNQGGLETWLMHILRHIDRDRFHIDFLVHTIQPCAYDDEIRSLGSQIIPCVHPSRPWLYAHNFQRILNEYGSYDIVHSHVHHFSGYVLRLAQQAGVAVRIAHSHIDSSPLETQAAWYRRLYLTLMKSLIAHHATLGLGCSQIAIVDLFGSAWKSDPRWQLLCYGIDLTPFQAFIDVVDVRVNFGIPTNAFVIGHVGRFHKQKNHQFLIEIFAELAKREPQAYLLLVGEGLLRPTIEQQVMQLGLGKQVIFVGRHSDVPKLMLGAMDVFLLPSLSEGLPMVGIEAQAAGLPLILSDVITDEINKIKPLIQKISLSQSVKVWSDAVLAARNFKARITQTDSIAVLKNSEFNISYSVKALTKIYVDECDKNCQPK